MISIENHNGGFKLKMSWPGSGFRGHSKKARDLAEVHEAVDHYFGQNATAHHSTGRPETCPLCREESK